MIYENSRENKRVLYVSMEVVTMHEINGMPAKWAPQIF
jgi:hypothetical protein